MIQPSMVIQAYKPQLHLGDWQIVVFAHRRRNRITVERWHSSEKAYHPLETTGQVIRINTGIRAFRRQMPVLASALAGIDLAGMDDEQVVTAVFEVLANLYRAGHQAEAAGFDDELLSEQDFAELLEEHRQEALASLEPVAH